MLESLPHSYHLGVHDVCPGQGFSPSPPDLSLSPVPGPASGGGRRGLTSAVWGVNGIVSGVRREQLWVRMTRGEAGPSGKTETQSHGVGEEMESDVGGKTQSERRESGVGGV